MNKTLIVSNCVKGQCLGQSTLKECISLVPTIVIFQMKIVNSQKLSDFSRSHNQYTYLSDSYCICLTLKVWPLMMRNYLKIVLEVFKKFEKWFLLKYFYYSNSLSIKEEDFHLKKPCIDSICQTLEILLFLVSLSFPSWLQKTFAMPVLYTCKPEDWLH